MFGRILPPLYGELKFLGEFGGGFIPRVSRWRDIGSRGFGSSGGFSGDSNFSFGSGLSSSSRYRLLGTSGAASEKSEPDG
jgi:hypothetical protein